MHRPARRRLHVRTLWISDVHLGFRACSAEALLAFLDEVSCDTLILVGDIIDVWSLKKSFYWPAAHNEVLRRFLLMAREGTRVIYVPGNHDDVFREYAGMRFGNVEVHLDYVHETADGKRLLVVHGDEFDQVVQFSPLLARIGARTYEALIWINTWLTRARRRLGHHSHWSLAAYLKYKVKNAVQYLSEFGRIVSAEARRRGVDGLVCGHIHHAEISRIDGVTYCNDGDWVESCTALVEHADGRLEILSWREMQAALAAEAELGVASLGRAA